MVIKDKDYWKEYNQKRKEYLTQKKREQRERLRTMSTTKLEIIMSTTEPLKVVDQKETNQSIIDI